MKRLAVLLILLAVPVQILAQEKRPYGIPTGTVESPLYMPEFTTCTNCFESSTVTVTSDTASQLTLSKKDGTPVATCNLSSTDSAISGCQLEAGKTLDDVMSAWLALYLRDIK